MAQALPKIGLRPFLPADTSILAAIFIASIEELTEDSYSEAQREAWASRAEDEAAFGKQLGSQLTLIATMQGSPVGFVSLKGADELDMLYVHPGAVRQGVASTLCDALEKLAAARGAKRMSVDASDSAQEFSEEVHGCSLLVENRCLKVVSRKCEELRSGTCDLIELVQRVRPIGR